MKYKTMALELLRERTEMYEELRLTRRLLPTLDDLATDLKASHEAWKQTLAAAKPGSEPNQLASEAMEMALKELEGRLSPAVPGDEQAPLSLEKAMAFVQSHTSNG